MKRAVNLLRDSIHYRKEAFNSGLIAVGFDVVLELRDPGCDDLLVMWNRYAGYDDRARHWEKCGARVVVAENGHMGKSWRGGDWYALALHHHSGAGKWNVGGPERWDSWGAEMAPWRASGETVILGQRGIGEPGIASPNGWEELVQKRIGGRIRRHPGTKTDVISLEDDLKDCGQVVTWHSGAALLALVMGIPVWYDFPQWIGGGAGRSLREWPGEPKRDDAARLECFRRLAFAQWQLEEIASGQAFENLLCL